MDYQKEIIELLNKLSSQMCSKIDGIHFEINSMKSAISKLNKKIDENSKYINILTQSLNDLHTANDKILKNMDTLNKCDNSNIEILKDELTHNLRNDIKLLNECINQTSSKIIDSHNSTSFILESMAEDLKFLTHKSLQSEKDLFNIQEKLKKIK